MRACDEVQGTFALTIEGRGFASKVSPGILTDDFFSSDCVSCGACVQACPTATLSEKSLIEIGTPDRSIITTCAYCGVGCSFKAEMRGDELVRMTPYKHGKANRGHSCVKGRFAYGYAMHQDRILKPMIRAKVTDPWKEVSWEEAIGYAASEFKRIQAEHGRDAVGGITSSRCTNEETFLVQKLVRAAFGNDWLRIGGLKGFADGSLGSTTALFFEPYRDAPDTRGLFFEQMLPEGIMLQRVAAADKLGLQVMIHAIGDRANACILDLYREVAEQNGPRDRRFRIEHAQHLRAADIPRFGRQKVIASMQPYHAADDGRWCEKRIGTERSRGTYAFRALLDSGAVLAFGTDWTVAPLNPMLGLKAAVTRQTLDGKHPDGWFPDQKITLDEAIRAYTVGSAYAEFAEHAKGALSPGKLADLVMLDRDLYRINPADIDQARVLLTVVDGRVVWEAK